MINALSEITKDIFAVIEGSTLFPGSTPDFYKKSETFRQYFKLVLDSEKDVFGDIRFTKSGVRTLNLKMGDLNSLSLDALRPALEADLYVVFGSSYIKGPLGDFLVEKKAINIHMGVSPFFRGTACNFWALYDRKPEYVGATIHRLSKGLDSGPILFHALPQPEKIDGFTLGMKAVKAAHNGFIKNLTSGKLFSMEPVEQDKSIQLRYTRNQDFTDEIAKLYLEERILPEEIQKTLSTRQESRFLRPFIDS